jgi:anti-sigma factor (TIGR02949 family)
MQVINFEEKACERVRKQLDAFVSDELAAEAKLAVTSHLASCSACAEALEARQRVKQALKEAITNDEGAPAALRNRILKEIGQHSAPAANRNYRQWWLAAAAALLLCAVGFGLLRWSNQQHAPAADLASLTETASEPNARVLKIGLGDHVHCAVGRDYSAGPRSFERMAQEMGPDFINLVPLVRERVPADYAVMIAHQCKFEGRSFVHLILSNQQTLLSLVLTKKNGEAFDQNNVGAIVQASGVPLHQMSAQNLAVAGFETRDYLAFVVSNLDTNNNLQIATKLAPAVRDFLAKLAG